MPPQPIPVKPVEGHKKSIMILSSKGAMRPEKTEGTEETEIAAHISVPHEGGWGWVVVACSFFSILILDGVVFTFGSLLQDMTVDLNQSEALIALINSIAVALYFISGPMASALINRFGFRECTMAGSVICSTCLLVTYFTSNYATLCVFYGIFAGFGYSLINLSSGLVVGFYFEKLRAIVLSISSAGSSIGIMIMFPLNSYLVKIGGWRSVTLLHSGLFGMIYFSGMAFRPLLSFSLIKTADESTRTVAYLPSLSAGLLVSRTKIAAEVSPTTTEKLFGAVSNYNFPTAAAVIKDETDATQAGPSAGATSKLTLFPNNPEGGISRIQLKQVQSVLAPSTSIVYFPEANKTKTEKSAASVKPTNHEPIKKRGFIRRLFTWEKNVPQSRPLYRDDAFYEGKVENLPEYHKSVMDISKEARTGLEYRLAVSRAAAASDLNERRGIFTTAVRRILATMMDPNLLRKTSFRLLCMSGFFTYVGFLVPYVYIKDRNLHEGIDSKHCTWFVSAIGFSNVFGRLVVGLLAFKIDPVRIAATSCILAGISTSLSNLSFSLHYQYFYCFMFGFCTASIASLRSMVLVSLYGLEKLTNATGMILLFQGFGSLVSTPMASALKNNFGYNISFIVAGISITFSGLIVTPVRYISNKEER